MTDIQMYPDGRMDSKNAAKYLGFSPATLATWRCRKIGPCYIRRGKIFYRKADLDKFITDGFVITEPLYPTIN